MQDRPTAGELLEAVQEFLERDVVTLGGRVGFHGRVAANVVAMVRRELELGPELDTAEREGLRALLGPGMPEDLKEANAELARRIRAGELDARDPELVAHLRRTVAGKLRVANPGHLEEGR